MCGGRTRKGENYGFAGLECFLGVSHCPLVGPLLVGIAPIDVGVSLPRAGRFSGIEAEGTAAVAVVVSVVLDVGLGGRVHRAGQDQAL